MIRNRVRCFVGKWSSPTTGVLSLRQNFSWTFLGNTVFAAAQWAMLVVLAKVGSSELVGQFALALAVSAPIMLLANLKLRAVLATDAKEEYPFGLYLALRIITTILAIIVIAVFALVGDYSTETRLVIILVGIAKAFDAGSDILYGYMQQHERMDRIAISRMLQGGTQLASLAVVIIATGSLVLAVSAWALASGLVTFLYDLPNVKKLNRMLGNERALNPTHGFHGDQNLRPDWHWKALRRLFRITLPLGLAVMLGSLWINIPRYFIAGYWGESSLGIFAAIASLMLIGGTIIGALGQSASPRLAKQHADRQYDAFDRLLLRLVAMGILLGLIGLVFVKTSGYPLLSFIYTPEYAERVDVLQWIMLVYCVQFSYVFLGTAIQAMRNFKIQLPIQIVSALIVLVFSLLLIPSYGLLGAVWAMLGANTFELVAYTVTFLMIRHDKRWYRVEESSI